ncbi:PREDICTED: basic 7S globulin [Tarenaya hassleriana]|uniref:basic 7S globulin n=1 Tax=Tarenaya hassleriana TaxID=28532 RepID=UPI00053C4DD7|nr:PREDICTED: basic 7S globulin [Tarenaya hassleriana]
MASSSSLALVLFYFSALSLSHPLNAVVFPVSRDLPTGQYVAQIRLGESPEPVKLVVDLSGTILWFDCSSSSSSSRNLTSGNSSDCARARAGAHRVSSSRGDDSVCQLLIRNGVMGFSARGELAGDFLAVGSDSSATSPGAVDLLFACAPRWLLRGLAGEAHGVLGLGRAQISLPSQLVSETIERRRFTVYLLPTNGVVSTSSAEVVFGAEVSRLLVYTPLFTDPSGNYVINVKSIRVNGVKISVNAPLSAELSTVIPYTVVESSIYMMIAESLAEAATATATAVAPFGLCFADTTPIPAVEFALQSEMVRWRIHGRNLMVDVGGGIRCLGIIDGGSGRVNPIVMGGLQLEGFVLDFDLGNSVLGFGQRRTGSVSNSLPLEAL